jgi:hypothetical protein
MSFTVSKQPFALNSGNNGANTVTEGMTEYTSFAGADIVATFDNRIFGNLQAVSYAVQREIAPVYVMGHKDPVSFAKNKRGISGSLVFIVFDRHALLTALKKDMNVSGSGSVMDDAARKAFAGGDDSTSITLYDNLLGIAQQDITYSDQIPPFDITITMVNEEGKMSGLQILGVQILNEGLGMSIDDVVLEQACTFIAREVKPLRSFK